MKTKEYRRRQKQLMDMMGAGAIAILPTAPVCLRNRDVAFPFRPDSDFYYLSGYPEPEAVAVLIPDRPAGEFILFCRPRDPELEIWHGRRAGLEGAVAAYGADDAFPIEDLDDILPGLIENRARVFYNMGHEPEFDQRVLGWVNRLRGKARSGVVAPGEFIALDPLLHDMRLYKSRHELKLMRRAARVSVDAHRRAMRACRPGLYEYQLEAELSHEFRRQGATAPAYPSIVGAGENACILHYTDNAARIADGDLVLIDAGAEYQGYASDITRTFPANGRFAPAQRQIYELVLAAQRAAIAAVRPGNHWNDPHEAAVRVLTEGLVALGILKGKPEAAIKDRAYEPYYMHRTGHWLGMDVHDVGDYKVDGGWRLLEPGMVLTVEPGLYFPASGKGLAKKWRNIGVRIEDDVLVTEDGCEVLSGDAPRTVAEIEALMADAA